jgi:hypothetical protein
MRYLSDHFLYWHYWLQGGNVSINAQDITNTASNITANNLGITANNLNIATQQNTTDLKAGGGE